MRIALRHKGFSIVRGWSGRLRYRAHRATAATLALVLVAAGLGVPAVAQAAPRATAPPVHDVRVLHETSQHITAHRPKAMPAWQPTAVRWPSGTATATLKGGTAAAPAGTLPVSVGKATTGAPNTTTPSRVRVTVSPRTTAAKAGVDGVAWSVARGDGTANAGRVRVTLGYGTFQDAFGGDWASRLRLVALPSCALTTPAQRQCRTQTPLHAMNDLRDGRLAADVTLPSGDKTLVLAADASASGGAGDYTATSLQPSGSWQAGGSTDAFTWSYPIPVPDVPGGLKPTVGLSYDSQSQDGLTSSTNNQPSWIGDGWDYSPGFVERSYQSCHENPAGTTQTFDSCWSDKAPITLSLNGSSTTLVKDDSTGAWHPQNDNNEKVEFLTGASNGANKGEYWRITTTDGTQYYFGVNQLPGYASGDDATNSTWTQPVFATSSGQPCYSATFADSWCQQAYRWNLDYVVDTHSDAVAYFYDTDTNYYARNLGSTANTSYTRDGVLKRIQYGQRDGQAYSTQPAAQVTFTVNGRCDTAPGGCATSALTSSTATNWPDTPYDLNCAQNAACGTQSPTFWTENELTGISTQVLSGSSESTVDSWSLAHSFPDSGDQNSPTLWLSSITHTGNDTTAGGSASAITLPAVTFTGEALSNRVDLADGLPPITRHRLENVVTESGEELTVVYSAATPASAIPSDASRNTTLAFPDYWVPAGESDPELDWFNKYIVKTVAEQDAWSSSGPGLALNDAIVTTYTPVGSPAWHYNDNPLTPDKQRTWDQFRGYPGMTVSTGTAPDPVTKTTYTYFRGMNGDTLPGGGTRSATVADSRGDPAVTDSDQLSGGTYETQVFNGSQLVTDTIVDPWSSATASHALSGLPTLHAYHSGTARSRVYTPLASGTTKENETDYTHDAYGRATKVDDKGDVSTGADDLCTTTTFADNTTAWILDAPSEVDTVSVDCATTPTLPDDAVSDVQTFYDSSTTLGAGPTVGDVTTVQQATSYTGATPTFTTMSTGTFDQYGRPLTAVDADSRTTKTAYTPATGAEPTSITVTDPVGLATTTKYDPLRELATTVTDPAGYATTKQYDALGRVTAVWVPGEGTANPATTKYTYTVSSTAPSVVDTYTVNDKLVNGALTYRMSETLYDSMLRAIETQTQTPDNKRQVTDTIYNTDGWVAETQGPYVDGAPVSTSLLDAQPGDVDSSTGYTYDGSGRKTAAISYTHTNETWRTTYTYGGNFTTVVPPAGATPTTTVTDARGNTTDLIEYHAGVTPDYLNAPPSGYDDTHFTFTPSGKTSTETDAAGNTWSWNYNLLGQQTDSYDPDTGHSTSTYDNAGQLTTATDARGKQLTYTYDKDGRKTGEYDTTSTQTLSSGNKLAAWTYDTVKKGLPASTTSYSGGDTITNTVLDYNSWGNVHNERLTLSGEGTSLVPAAGLTFTYTDTITGLPQSETDPAAGGLSQETIDYGYGDFDLPTSVGSTTSSYVWAVGYNELGQPLQYSMGTGGTVWVNLSYDQQTQALTNVQTTDNTTSGDVDNLTYTYGNDTVSKGAGLVTKTVDKQNAGTTVDTQCFTYDYATRLQQAWTATDDCAATPTPGNSPTVGGTQPYWQSWTYDAAGDRATQTDHDTTANDTTTAYHYPTAGSGTDQPHTLANTTATGPNATTQTASYTYDPAGNTQTITGGATGNQTLAWNDQGQLSTDTTAGGTTSYVYNADGSLFARRDPGKTTLFIGDEQLSVDTTTGVVSGSRYYSINGTTIAVRTSDTTWYELIPDRQGTDQIAINDNGQAVTRRSYTPFGQPRGVASFWPGDLGYIGGTPDDATGLENLGAREYSPTTGRFISADPVLEPSDPNQLNGYDYAGNDPITNSDPSGQFIRGDDGEGYGTGAQADAADAASYQRQQATTYDLVKKGNQSVVVSEGPGSDGRSHYSINGIPLDDGANPYVLAWNMVTHPYHGSHLNGLETPLELTLSELGAACNATGASGSGCSQTYGQAMLDLARQMYEAQHHIHAKGLKAAFLNALSTFIQLLPEMARSSNGAGEAGAVGGEEEDNIEAAIKGEAGMCNSFDPATPVLMADGSTKSIKDIKVGEKVAAADPTTRLVKPEKVTQLHKNLDVDLTDITVRVGASTSVLHTTGLHLFWNATNRTWMPADRLAIDARLYSTAGTPVTILAVHSWVGEQDMRNLTVDQLHTYFVMIGNTPILVHNVGECPVNGIPHGKLGELATLDRLISEGYQNITREVRFVNSAGNVFKADFVARTPSGQWIAIETKTGAGAEISDNQNIGYPELDSTQGAVLDTSRLEPYGLYKGDRLSMPVKIDEWHCPACGS